MKLGVSYNIFDGEELLEASVRCIRSGAKFISVVYQTISNHGGLCDLNLMPLLEDLRRSGLIDKQVLFIPDFSLTPAQNETRKRNIGHELSRQAGCDYHLSMDTDEFYDAVEFENACFCIELKGYDLTACHMQSYYRHPYLAIDPPEAYYVTFITRIHKNSEFLLGGYFPVIVDPTRRMNEGDGYKQCIFHAFCRSDIQMHHMSYVRKNIRKKLENSSAKHNFSSDIDALVEHYEGFTEGDPALFAGAPPVYHDLRKVDNDFGITIQA